LRDQIDLYSGIIRTILQKGWDLLTKAGFVVAAIIAASPGA
jgi:hypothetical protein